MSRRLPELIAACRSIGATRVAPTAEWIESWLGRPKPIVPLDPPADDPLTAGLLDIEEDVFHDSYELAARTFAAHIDRWREGVSLAPLTSAAKALEEAGLTVDLVDWRSENPHSAAEFAFACRVAAALGGALLCLPYSSYAAARETGRRAREYGARVALTLDASRSPSEFADAIAAGTGHSIALSASHASVQSIQEQVTREPDLGSRLIAVFVEASGAVLDPQAIINSFEKAGVARPGSGLFVILEDQLATASR